MKIAYCTSNCNFGQSQLYNTKHKSHEQCGKHQWPSLAQKLLRIVKLLGIELCLMILCFLPYASLGATMWTAVCQGIFLQVPCSKAPCVHCAINLNHVHPCLGRWENVLHSVSKPRRLLTMHTWLGKVSLLLDCWQWAKSTQFSQTLKNKYTSLSKS